MHKPLLHALCALYELVLSLIGGACYKVIYQTPACKYPPSLPLPVCEQTTVQRISQHALESTSCFITQMDLSEAPVSADSPDSWYLMSE